MSLTSCQEEPFAPVEDVVFGRVLTPTDLTASVTSAGDVVLFDWNKSKGATDFELEIAKDSTFASKGEVVTVSVDQLPYSHKLVADETYYYRVRGIDSENVLEPSNWAVAKDPDTGYMLEIKTYAIKPSVNPVVADRSDKSITLAWTPASSSDNEVSHILIESPGAKSVEFPVPAESASTGVEVTGLTPSTMYTLTVYFKSANRGSVLAWTRPSTEGFTSVTDTASFKQAVKDGATKIRVAYSETPYVMGSVNLTGDASIVGESSESGTKPVIAGSFVTSEGISSIRLEDLTLSGAEVKANADGTGGMSLQGHLITISSKCNLADVELVNVNIDTYQKGIYYDNNGAAITGHFLLEGVRVDNIIGSGGDCIDVRNEGSIIPEFVIRNSTFNGGCRTVVRLDAKVQLGKVLIENNTFNNMCYDGSALKIGGSNVQGILAVKSTSVTEFDVKNNLFLNNNCWLVGSNKDCKIPTFTQNYYYKCVESFFTSAKEDGSSAKEGMTQAAATANEGLILENDPCTDSMGSIFNVTEPSVIKKNVGDPRWFLPYVEIPEDLTQEVTSAVHTWDFSDTKTFYKGAEKDMVRDGIRFYVKNTPIMFNGGLEYTGASTLEENVPVDGAIGIKVNEPGSIVVSTAASELAGDHSHLTVSLNGEVSASVPVGAEYQKVTFPNITEESTIYITACDPIAITFLQWTSDVQVLDKVLATPVVSIDKTVVNERADGEITLTWEPVDYAASYNVTIDGKKKNITETTYSFATATFAVEEEGGDFAIQVTAVPAEDDYTREESAAAELSFHVNDVPEEPGVKVVTYYLTFPTAATADAKYVCENNDGFYVVGEGLVVDSSTAAFAVTGATQHDKEFTTRLKGSTSKTITITVPNDGVLYLAARSSNGSATDRTISLSQNDALILEPTVCKDEDMWATDKSKTYPYVIANVKAGDITITMAGSGGINLYGIRYDATEGSVAEKVDKVWDFSATEWVDVMTNCGYPAGDKNNTTLDVEVDGLKVIAAGGSMIWNQSGETYYWQPGGKSDGTKRYFEFTTDVAGVLSVYSSNTSGSEDLTRMVTVQVGDAEAESLPGGSPSSSEPTKNDFTVGAGTVKIYPTGNALRFYKIEFHSL